MQIQKPMYTNLLDEIENAFYEGFSDNVIRKHGKGYVGPLSIEEKEDHYLIKKVIVGIDSKEITANVRKSILKVFVNNEKQKPIDVVSLKVDSDLLNVSKISSKLKNGILEITIPKQESSKAFQIKID